MKAVIVVLVIVVVIAIIYLATKKKPTAAKTPLEAAASDTKLKIVPVVLNRQLSFVSDVAGYFKELKLDSQNDTPIIIDGKKMAKLVKGVPQSNGSSLFMGVYHEATNTITDYRLLTAESFDAQTQEVLGKGEDGIVVLQ